MTAATPFPAIRKVLHLLSCDTEPSSSHIRSAFGELLADPPPSPTLIAALLMGLRARGETFPVLLGAFGALGDAVIRIKTPKVCCDIVGTGGDHTGSLNISTASALLLAACGVPTAKHGYRKVSSLAGASDVLEALGVPATLSPPDAQRLLDETGFAFLFAPNYQPIGKVVAPVRSEMGVRTIFNILGPLCNPANPPYMLVGCFSDPLKDLFASVLEKGTAKAAWVVHNSLGFDELAPCGVNRVCEIRNGRTEPRTLCAADFGLDDIDAETLRGGNPDENAEVIRQTFHGKPTPLTPAVLMNAAAVLFLCGRATDLKHGCRQASDVLASGKAADLLERLRTWQQQ